MSEFTEAVRAFLLPTNKTVLIKEQPVPEIVRNESSAWQKVLGKRVEISPLPSVVTPEVREKLKDLELELRFIPKLDLKTIEELRDVKKYLHQLEKRYPGWKQYESLKIGEKTDTSRNLEEAFWRQVETGNIDFPQLPGIWVAVETMPKPASGNQYKKTKITKMLGFSDRFNLPWNTVQGAIQKAKQAILSAAGLPDNLNVRMLEILEWNLLANREGWGATDTHEWTNTQCRGNGKAIFAGYSKFGGAACFNTCHLDNSETNRGFRLAVILGS